MLRAKWSLPEMTSRTYLEGEKEESSTVQTGLGGPLNVADRNQPNRGYICTKNRRLQFINKNAKKSWDQNKKRPNG